MAEVGVLNLTIHDNSEEAGYGLDKLADALGRVKRAVGTGLNLSSVAEEVTKLAKTIQEARGTSTIVKNLGTMFNAINQFSKIKSFSIDTEKIRDLADNMIKLADAKEKVDAVTKSNAGLGDWRTSMNGVAEGASKAVESVQKSVNTYESTMSDLTETARKSSDYLSRMAAMGVFGTSMPKSAQSPGQISMFEDLKSKVDEITQSYIEFEKTTEEYRYKAMDVMSIMDKPLEYMRDIYKTPTVSMEDYKNAIGAALPKVQQLSSEEMVAAAQAKIAKESIDGIIKTLEKPISYKGIKGFIDAMTGVAKGSQGPGLINESTSMFSLPEAAGGAFKKVEEATEGLIRVFDKASGSYREMGYSAEKQAETLEKTSESIQTAKDQIRQFTDLTKIPASGANGMFKNVSEEVQYLQGQLENAKTSMRQFNEVAANAEKQLKYGGPISKDELSFNLKHATEGFYQMAEAEQKYQRAIEDALSYAQQYKEKLSSEADTSTALDPVTSAVEKLDDTVNEAANDGLENFKQGMEKIEEPANRVLSKIELLQNRAKFLKERLRNLFSMPAKDEEGNDTGRDNAINETLLKISAVNEQITKLIDKAHDAQDALKFDSLKSGADNLQRAYGNEVVQNLVENYSEVDLLTMKLEGMKQALADDINQNKIDTQQIADRTIAIQNLRDKIESLITEQEEASRSTTTLGSAWSGLKNGIKGMFPTLTGLLKRFKSMAIMRSLRYLIRQLSAGFSEGVKNVYWYSKAIGSTFSSSMDSAAGSLLQMKNSIGAAVAPVIESLIPYLQVAVNWFITLVNYVNQFFALMRGQTTWTRAVYNTTDAYEDQTKKAKSASAAVKDLLADWDELNIIQSNSSGSGVSTDAATDYLSMFEEVAEFDNSVSSLVKNIKEVFGDVWTLVGKIAAGILGWKVASAFTGVLSTLGGLIAGISVIDLVFNISKIFDNQFFDTGDTGWLVADVLETFIGATLMQRILNIVLGGGAGEIGIPLIFGISALATIFANVERTDISALSEESILASLTAALEGGVAAGYLAYLVGDGLGSALAGGSVGLIGTFGIALGLKADAQIIADGITEENVLAKLGSITALGISGAMIGARVGGTLAAAEGMAMLFGGVPIATFGVAIGIDAINQTVDAYQITSAAVIENLVSGGLVGAGLALEAAALGYSALLVGSVAGALVIGALFAIEAYIAAQPVKVVWGDYEATKAEIETFVNESMFKDPPDVLISAINATVEPLGAAKDQLEADLSNAIGTLYSVHLGLKHSTPEDLRTQIDQVVTSFNNASEQYQNTLEVALSLVPVEGSEEASSGIIQNSSERWTELTGIMTNLGNELADAYKVAYDAKLNGNIDETAEATIKKLSTMLQRVATAISTGQARAKVDEVMRQQVQNLSDATLKGVLDTFEAQRDALIEEMRKIRLDSAEGILSQQYAYEELAEYALRDAGGDTTDATYKYYMDKAKEAKDDYKALLATLNEDVEKAVDKYTKTESTESIKQYMIDSIVNALPDNAEEALRSAGFEPDVLMQDIADAMTSGDMDKVRDNMEYMFDQLLADLVGNDNFSKYKQAIDNHILSYTDLFDQDLIDEIKRNLNIDSQSSDVQGVWNKLLGEEIETPDLNWWPFNQSLNAWKTLTRNTVDGIKAILNEVDGLSVTMDVNGLDYNDSSYGRRGSGGVSNGHLRVEGYRATGGFVKSGDLIMANENGNIEMMGKMGNQPVVANNQQIVSGITQGVATANGDVVSELRGLATDVRRILNKEFTVKYTPSATAGRVNQKSAEAYSRVTG